MTVTIYLPELGEAVTEGTISRWLVQPGDSVDVETPLAEIATDKVDTEIPCTTAGTIVELLVVEDDVVAIGAGIARIEPTPTPTPGSLPSEKLPAPDAASPEPTARSPLTASRPEVEQPQPLPRIRQTIARRMVESVRTAAHVTTVVEVDVTTIAEQRRSYAEELRRRAGVKASFLPFFVRAAVLSLRDHPVISATLNADATTVTYRSDVALGIAVDGPKGLMVPVIRDAAHLRISELATAIADVADRVRAGSVAPDELVGGTFTITNTGSRGALFDTPIINQPQSAILGTGAVVERVVPRRSGAGDLTLTVRSMVYLSLSYDHRIIDGADAARYLGAVKARLESGFGPEELP